MENFSIEQLVERLAQLEEKNKELEQLILSIFRPIETYVTFSELKK